MLVLAQFHTDFGRVCPVLGVGTGRISCAALLRGLLSTVLPFSLP